MNQQIEVKTTHPRFYLVLVERTCWFIVKWAYKIYPLRPFFGDEGMAACP